MAEQDVVNELSKTEIQNQLQKMVAGMPKDLAARRAYCIDCRRFLSDRYSHLAISPQHKLFGVMEMRNDGVVLETKPSTRNKKAKIKLQSAHDIVLKRVEQVKALRAQGFNLQEISGKMNLSAGSIHYYAYYPNYPHKKSPKKPNRRILSVLGSEVADAAADKETVSTGTEFQYGFFIGSLEWMMMSFANDNGLEVSALRSHVLQHLKRKEVKSL